MLGVSKCLTRAGVIEFRVEPAVQALDLFAEEANDGTLDEDERSEYEAFVDAVELISILQL